MNQLIKFTEKGISTSVQKDSCNATKLHQKSVRVIVSQDMITSNTQRSLVHDDHVVQGVKDGHKMVIGHNQEEVSHPTLGNLQRNKSA
jgi:hypothetical protein